MHSEKRTWSPTGPSHFGVLLSKNYWEIPCIRIPVQSCITYAWLYTHNRNYYCGLLFKPHFDVQEPYPAYLSKWEGRIFLILRHEIWIRLIPAQWKATSWCHFYNYFSDQSFFLSLLPLTVPVYPIYPIYKEPDRDVNIKSRHTKLELPVAIKISLLPAALSIMKTQMPVDPKKKKPFCFRVTYSFLLFPVWTYGICSTVPAAKYLAKGLHSDDHCSAKKITKVFNGTNYWEQETGERKK